MNCSLAAQMVLRYTEAPIPRTEQPSCVSGWGCSGWREQTRGSNLLLLDHYPSATFKEFWGPVATGWFAMHCRWKYPNTNFHYAQAIWQEKWLMHQIEANKQHFALIGWLNHLGVWTPYSITKTQKWPKLTFKRPATSFFSNREKAISYSKSAYQAVWKGMRETRRWNRKLKEATLLFITSCRLA